MHAFGIALLSLGALGLVYLAAQIAWQEAKSLNYLDEPWGDEWQ